MPDMQVRYGTRTRSVAPTPRLPRVFSFSLLLLLLFFFLCCLCSLALGGIRNIGKCGAYSSCDDLFFSLGGTKKDMKNNMKFLVGGESVPGLLHAIPTFPMFPAIFSADD